MRCAPATSAARPSLMMIKLHVPAGKLLYGKKLRTAAPNWLELEPMGFCVVEE